LHSVRAVVLLVFPLFFLGFSISFLWRSAAQLSSGECPDNRQVHAELLFLNLVIVPTVRTTVANNCRANTPALQQLLKVH